MAHPHRSAPAHPPIEATNMVDAVHRAGYAVDSLQALTDLMMIQEADTGASLSHVDRNALAGLINLVAQAIEAELKQADQHYRRLDA